MGTTKREQEDRNRMINNLIDVGFSRDEANALRRISMTLRHWYELECGTENDYGTSFAIERGSKIDCKFIADPDGKPFMRKARNTDKDGYVIHYTPTADRERGALKRIDAIMARHKNCTYYLQTDPRGAALYIVPKAQIKRYAKLWGHPVVIDSSYTTVGICVY